jgi:acetyl esterase
MGDSMAGGIVRSERLDAEARAYLEAGDRENGPRLEDLSVDEARRVRAAGFKKSSGVPVELGRVEPLRIPHAGGEIGARVYANDGEGVRAGLVYFHGGGFVLGDLDTHDPLCRALARESDAVVIAVDYRRAPEERFPAAVDDAFAATVWIAAHAAELGMDAQRIAVCGDSAGGTLATVTAMRCRDAGGPALAAQVLLYPITDMSSFATGSYVEFAENYGLTRAGMQWFAKHYLGEQDGRHAEASPLLAGNAGGLPPALVVVAEFDPLRDEGEAYAERMRAAGVPVTVARYAGMVHGFALMLGVLEAGRRVVREVGAFLREM